ncbi:hypothetical protein NYE37_10475 [Thermoactinomyces sp. FSL K6-2592]
MNSWQNGHGSTSLAGSIYTLTVSWYVVKETGAGQILGGRTWGS